MKKLNLVTAAIVLSLALGAPAVADTLKAPTPVKPAQPATMPVTTVPAQPAVKSPTTPTTPVIGKKPGTGPAARTGVIKVLVSTLRINGRSGPVTIGLSGTATVSWDLSSAPNASGVHLLVHTASLESMNCTAPPATASPDSGKYTTSPRALTLTNAYYRDRQTYYIKGCMFTRTIDPVTGQVTDSYTGDWTNQVVLRVDSRPDLHVAGATVHVQEPYYKVGPGWRVNPMVWDAITSSSPWYAFPPGGGYSAHIGNASSNQVGVWRATLLLNGKKYLNSFNPNPPLAPGEYRTIIFGRLNPPFGGFSGPPTALDIWRMYQQSPRLIMGTVYVDEENHIEESDEWNNFGQTRVQVMRHGPTDLRVVRDMRWNVSRLVLTWQRYNVFTSGYYIGVRYTLVPPRPAHGGIIIEPVLRIFQVDGNSASFALPEELPWSQMKDHRACFRVVGYSRSDSPAYELLSAPSNEDCTTVLE